MELKGEPCINSPFTLSLTTSPELAACSSSRCLSSTFPRKCILMPETRLRRWSGSRCCPIRFICSCWAACHACLQHGHRRCRLALPCCSAMLLRHGCLRRPSLLLLLMRCLRSAPSASDCLAMCCQVAHCYRRHAGHRVGVPNWNAHGRATGGLQVCRAADGGHR